MAVVCNFTKGVFRENLFYKIMCVCMYVYIYIYIYIYIYKIPSFRHGT